MSVTLYGIANCDTVAKARAWLGDKRIDYAFHDYKKLGIDEARLRGWCQAKGWEILLNRAGTTFKKLADADRTDLTLEKAISLMLANPSMIKRPVAEHPGGLLVGFKAEAWAAALS